jgi:hypothetical protein
MMHARFLTPKKKLGANKSFFASFLLARFVSFPSLY